MIGGEWISRRSYTGEYKNLKKSGDLISRQAAIDALEWTWAGKAAFDAIKSLPAAEPRRGKWILKPNIYGVAYCSECDYELHTNDTNYCPNCGAIMETGV